MIYFRGLITWSVLHFLKKNEIIIFFFLTIEFLQGLLRWQVPTSSECNVQCLGFPIKIYSCFEMPKDGIQNGPYDCNSVSVITHPGFLLHSKIWWPRMDDHAHILLGTIQWLSQCLYLHSSTQRLQGQLISLFTTCSTFNICHRLLTKFPLVFCSVGTIAKCLG